MESGDFIHDLDDAVSTEDEDGPGLKKRRRSLKGQKVRKFLIIFSFCGAVG